MILKRNAAALLFCLGLALSGTPAARAQETRYSPEQLRQDLAFLESEIRNNHPDLAHSVDPETFAQAVQTLGTQLDKSLTRDEAWKAFATLNPVLADGHLFVGFPGWRADAEAYLERGGTFFPFEVHLTDDGDVIVKALLGGGGTPFAGARLESINGVGVRQVSEELLARAHGDTPAFRAELVSRRWWFYYWKLYGSSGSFDLRFADKQFAAARLPGSREKPVFLADEASFERQFNLELLPCRGALLTASSFSWDKEPFLAFTRNAFDELRKAGVETLVIDVRANGGGDDDLWREGILPYIATQPYRWGSDYRKRILEAYRDEGEAAGDVVSGEIDEWIQPEPDNPLRFSGKVYVLIGRSTYSSAILFSNVMQDFGFGVVAGTGDSARANQSGSVQKSDLPNTGLVVWWPRFVLTRPSGAATPVYVEPDMAITEDPLQPRAAVDELMLRGNGQAPSPRPDRCRPVS